MNNRYLSLCFIVIAALLSLGSFNAALAQTAPSLGTASTYAALGASTVTCTDSATLTGDVGVSPGSAITGFPSCTYSGSINAANAAALLAQKDAALAYAFLLNPLDNTCTTNLTGQDLGVIGTLGSGVYCFDASAELTGTLNLTGPGPWIFQIGTTLTTATGAIVEVNGAAITPGSCLASSGDVFWAVGSSATLGTGTSFQGILISLVSDTLVSGTNLSGGVFALTGAVTIDGGSTGKIASCSSAGGVTPPATGTIKVTGGGQIHVPDTNSPGYASFGFIAVPTGTHFNYLNNMSGLHINGPVLSTVVIAYNPDGTPLTVLFSGTCGVGCSFVGTVEDHGQPNTNDQFGITVTTIVGGVAVPSESRTQRIVYHGNILFHKSK